MSAFLPPLSAAASTAPGARAATGAASPERAKLHHAATQFEALLVRQMLASARKADFGEELFGGGGAEGAMGTFRQMQDDSIADVVADTGSLGLSTMIEAQLARYLPNGT